MHRPQAEPQKKWISRGGWAALGAMALLALTKLKTIATIVVAALKFLKFGKILTTSGSMFVSVWFYSLAFRWQGIRSGVAHGPGVEPATVGQRIKMGLAYLALAGAVAWAMGETHTEWTPERKRQYFEQGT